MVRDQLENQTSVDAKTAEETLALAIRLQQEQGQRISIEELHRTAEEAGIDRVYVQSALEQVHKAQQKEQIAHEVEFKQVASEETYSRGRNRYRSMMMGMIVAMVMILYVSHGAGGRVLPLFFIMMFAMTVLKRTNGFGTCQNGSRRRFRD